MRTSVKSVLEKILLKSTLGYPVIGLCPEDALIPLSKKYNKNKWACGLVNTAFNLGLTGSLVTANYLKQEFLGNYDDNLVLNVLSKVASIGTWGWAAKSCLGNSARLVWMAYTKEPKGELAFEIGWRIYKEASLIVRKILHYADSDDLLRRKEV